MKKMNKAFCILCTWGIVAVLAGCGQASQTSSLPQNISAGTGGGQSDSGSKGSGENQESEGTESEKQKGERDAFGFLYKGVTLIPGEIFEPSLLGEASSFLEQENCAFGEKARIYNYETFELETYVEGEEERIYTIYIIDPNLPTTEGLCLGDTVDDMISLYGEDYDMVGTAYDYIGGEMVLSIITQNDIVVGIEYCLNK